MIWGLCIFAFCFYATYVIGQSKRRKEAEKEAADSYQEDKRQETVSQLDRIENKLDRLMDHLNYDEDIKREIEMSELACGALRK